jgi:cytoskeletal protein CcmA (bactofilin family)
MFDRKSSRPEAEAVPSAETGVPASPPEQAKSPAQAAPQRAHSEARAMIGSKVKVTGDIESSEDLLIEGEVNGTVSLAENELVIGNSGRVSADIEAKTIRIEGEVQGDITGRERVVITASGNVQGNVTAPRVMLEDGGRFKGSIDMGGSKAAAAPAPKAAPAQPAQQSKAGIAGLEAGAGGVGGVGKAS